jgi:hypothetical protein
MRAIRSIIFAFASSTGIRGRGFRHRDAEAQRGREEETKEETEEEKATTDYTDKRITQIRRNRREEEGRRTEQT